MKQPGILNQDRRLTGQRGKEVQFRRFGPTRLVKSDPHHRNRLSFAEDGQRHHCLNLIWEGARTRQQPGPTQIIQDNGGASIPSSQGQHPIQDPNILHRLAPADDDLRITCCGKENNPGDAGLKSLESPFQDAGNPLRKVQRGRDLLSHPEKQREVTQPISQTDPHLLKRFTQPGNLVISHHLDGFLQVAPGNLLCRAGQQIERTS